MLLRDLPLLFFLIAMSFIFVIEEDWATVIPAIALTIWLLARALRKVPQAKVTAAGIEKDHGPVTPFGSILRVVRDGRERPATVVTPDGQEDLSLADKDLVKLSRTSLNRWMIEDQKITVTAGEVGQELQITYEPQGKFSINCTELEDYFYWFLFAGLILGYLYGWGFKAMLSALVAYLLFFRLPLVFHEVQLSVVGDRIILRDEHLREYILRFADIAAVEKGLFRVKVTAKSGEVLYFPQGFVLLPELIEELAGSLADRK